MHEFHLDITFSWYDIFAIISWVLVFVSSFRYMYSIIKGKTKPNVVGWLLYQIATLCVLVSSYDLGAMSTIVASFAYTINQLIIIWDSHELDLLINVLNRIYTNWDDKLKELICIGFIENLISDDSGKMWKLKIILKHENLINCMTELSKFWYKM